MSDLPYSDSWIYEGIIGALPGIDVPPRLAVTLQFVLFEAAVLAVAAVYRLPEAAVTGTVAVAVSTGGSVLLLRIGRQVRESDVPTAYRRLLFGSNVEVVLAVLAFSALISYLFVVDPRSVSVPLVESLFGSEPPVVAIFVALLVLWDVCYRIGAGWWASVTALWRSARYSFDAEATASLRRADTATILFGVIQLAFLPVVWGRPALVIGIGGHVAAVVLVTGSSIYLLSRPADGS